MEVKRNKTKMEVRAAHLLRIALVFLLLVSLCVPAYAETPAEKLERLKQEQKGIEADKAVLRSARK